jgi:hypothetical protein
MERYKIVCKQCLSERTIEIHNTPLGQRIDWLESEENSHHPICSARLRFDGQWGFQCQCGNDNLWTTQESRVVVNKVSPSPKEISEIVNNLQDQEDNKFEMVKF